MRETRGGKRLDVLVIDHNESDRDTLCALLGAPRGALFQCSTASSVSEGLEAVARGGIDCVLLDWNSADADASTFLAEMNHAASVPQIPVVVVTGSGSEDVVERAFRLGASDYLGKDRVTRQALRDVVLKAVDTRSNWRVRAANPVRRCDVPALNEGRIATRVLVVDDDPQDRAMMRELLMTRSGGRFELVEAETAEEALDIVDRCPIDCVILDYNLPDCDGVELVRVLRSDPIERQVGIVLATGLGNEGVATEAFRAGVDTYLRKDTVTRDDLRRAVVTAAESARVRREMGTH
jgi:two-component system, sensor histidine kinase